MMVQASESRVGWVSRADAVMTASGRERQAHQSGQSAEHIERTARESLAITLGIDPGPPAYLKVGGKAVYVDLERASLVALPGRVQVSHAAAERAQSRREALARATSMSDTAARISRAQQAAAANWEVPAAAAPELHAPAASPHAPASAAPWSPSVPPAAATVGAGTVPAMPSTPAVS